MPVSVLDNFVEDPGNIPGSGSVPMSKMVQEPRPDSLFMYVLDPGPDSLAKKNIKRDPASKLNKEHPSQKNQGSIYSIKNHIPPPSFRNHIFSPSADKMQIILEILFI